MQNDPAQEWQRLNALYGEKSDEELLELAADFGNLTDVAQQVLRDELRRRGLTMPQASPPSESPRGGDRHRRPSFGAWSRTAAKQNRAVAAEDSPAEGDEEEALEYTWKTLLCTCDTREEAWQIAEVLRRAKIESWIEAPQQGSLDITGPRVIVAADQLEEAQAIAAQPIPQDVIDQSRVKPKDFEPPACPKCGAANPLLKSVEPVNRWLCDVCGATWSDGGRPVENTAPNSD